MRDSTLRCWRGVQNPAVLPAPPTTAMSNVSALSARSPSEHVAPEADSLTVDAPSAQPATPDAVTRNDSNETKTGSAQPDTTPSVPEPRSSRQRGTHEARHNREAHRQAQGARPDRVRLTEDADGISVHTFRRRTRYRRDISDRDELHPDVRFGQRPGFGAQGRRVTDHRVVSIWPSNTRFDRRSGSPARYRSERSG